MENEQPRRTTITRDWRATIWWLVPGATIFLGSCLLLWRGGPWLIGVFTLGSLYLCWRGFQTGTVAKCPSCDLPIHGVSITNNQATLCPYCTQYLSGRDGELWPTAEDYVADDCVFRTYVVDYVKPALPEGCCVCGAPATRTEEITYVEKDEPVAENLAVGVASLGLLKVVKNSTFAMSIPHCNAHTAGARLEPSTGSFRIAIVFRSHKYLLAYCALNQQQPIASVFSTVSGSL